MLPRITQHTSTQHNAYKGKTYHKHIAGNGTTYFYTT